MCPYCDWSYNQDHCDQQSSVMCLPNQVRIRQIDRYFTIVIGPIIKIIAINNQPSVMCLPNQVRQTDKCVSIVIGPIIRVIVINSLL